MAARATSWPFATLRALPFSLLLSIIHAHNVAEGAATAWVVPDETETDTDLTYLLTLCHN